MLENKSLLHDWVQVMVLGEILQVGEYAAGGAWQGVSSGCRAAGVSSH